jgi:hypothetical protein
MYRTSSSDAAPDPLIEKGRIEKQLPRYSFDFASIRKAADAELANHARGFRLFSIRLKVALNNPRVYELWAKENTDKGQFDSFIFDYVRPVRSGWEVLEMDSFSGIPDNPRVAPPSYIGLGVTASFTDARSAPQPDPAPADMPATEAALLRLVRSIPVDIIRNGAYNNVRVQTTDIRLTQAGSTTWGRQSSSPEPYEHDFFTATAPRGRWLWWSIMLPPEGMTDEKNLRQDRKFIYVDAVTGAVTSHCAESIGLPIRQLVAIPCK